MSIILSPKVLPVLLLVASKLFMTFAWYGHRSSSLRPLTRGAAFLGHRLLEYWLAVPANRIGHEAYSAAELKTIQEVVTLAVFSVFSVTFLRESLGWNHAAGFALIAGGAALVFRG